MPGISSRPLFGALFLVALLAAVPALASERTSYCCDFCPDEYRQSGDFPFDETIRLANDLAGSEVTPAMGWRRIFESCEATRGVTIDATSDVVLVLRAYLQLDARSTVGTTFAYRWLVDDVVVSNEAVHHVRGGFPQADDFATIVPRLPAGPHRVAIEARVDGAPSERIHFDVHYIAAQGFPADRLPADVQLAADEQRIGAEWTTVAAPVELTTASATHLFLQGQLTFVSGRSGDAVDVRFVVNGAPMLPLTIGVPPDFPEAVQLFDHLLGGSGGNAAGHVTVSLEARVRSGEPATVRMRLLEAFTTPAVANDGHTSIAALDLDAAPDVPTVVSAETHGVQPVDCLLVDGDSGGPGGEPGCGRYTLLLDGTLPPQEGNGAYTMIGDGFLEFVNRSGSDGIVSLAIETLYLEPSTSGGASRCDAKLFATEPTSCGSASSCHSGDFTFTTFDVPPGRSQKAIFSEFFDWGVRYPNRVRVWLRKVTDCFDGAGSDGVVTVGRRSLALQLVPVSSGSCFSTRSLHRAAAPTVSARYESGGTNGVLLFFSGLPAGERSTYEIVRADGDGAFATIGIAAAHEPVFVDHAVTPGHVYRYRVRVLDSQTFFDMTICGTLSDPVSVSIPTPRRRAIGKR